MMSDQLRFKTVRWLCSSCVVAVLLESGIAEADNALVNDPTGEMTSMTQSGAVVAYNEDNGTLCAAYNDSYHGIVEITGFTGFSSSGDNGVTWVDHGSLDASSYGYPAIVWRRADSNFYLVTLHAAGLGMWSLGSDCSTATFKGMVVNSSASDREMVAVDNNPTSTHYGRLYVVWTDYSSSSHIYAARSSDGGDIWSSPMDISLHDLVTNAWPAVDPITGDVYVAWTHWDTYPTGPIDIEMTLSTDGGATWNPVTNPMSDQVNPRDLAATANCGRPALNGDIRHTPAPQIAVDSDSNIHAIYSYDPDGYDVGDVINIYYRRSLDQGSTWETEILINDDATTTDQFFPALAVSENGDIGVFWYDRRLDSSTNLTYDRYMALSLDGGNSFEANQRISEVSSLVAHDANLATCFHGDYDGATAGGGYLYAIWSDDRNSNADVWSESIDLGGGDTDTDTDTDTDIDTDTDTDTGTDSDTDTDTDTDSDSDDNGDSGGDSGCGCRGVEADTGRSLLFLLMA